MRLHNATMWSWRDPLGIICLTVLGAIAYQGVLTTSFWSADAWAHLDVAQGLLKGEPAAWKMPFLGDTPVEAMRLTPYLLFVTDWLLYGPEPAGYYATNLAIAWVCMLSIFVLLRALGVGPERASIALLSFIFLPPIQQLIYWVPARDDGCAVALALVTLAAWSRLRARPNRRWVCWLFFGLACFGKAPMALQLLSALAALELCFLGQDGSGPKAQMTSLLPFVAVSAVSGIALWMAMSGRHFGASDLGFAPPEILFLRLTSLVLPAYPFGEGFSTVERVLSVALGVGSLFALVFRRSPENTALLRIGGGLFFGGVVPILPWLLRSDSAGTGQARYLLLASAGTPFFVAAILMGGKGSVVRVWRGALGLLVAVCFVTSGVPTAKRTLGMQISSSSQLVDLMLSLEEELSGANSLYLGVRQPDHGVTSLIASPLWSVLFPESPSPVAFVQGNTTVSRSGGDGYNSDPFQSTHETALDVRELPESALVVWQVPSKAGLTWQVAAIGTDWPTAPLASQQPMAWGNHHSQRRYPNSRIYRELQQIGIRLPSLELPARLDGACTLHFQFSAPEGRDQAVDAFEEGLITSDYAIGSFGRGKDAFLIPVDPHTHRATLFLPNLAGSRPVGTKMRLLASNRPGEIHLLGLKMTACVAP